MAIQLFEFENITWSLMVAHHEPKDLHDYKPKKIVIVSLFEIDKRPAALCLHQKDFDRLNQGGC